jgi:hypothetical protein
MECSSVFFSRHALQRMFHRAIAANDVLAVLRTGEVIADYPLDTPFPSQLLLGFGTGNRCMYWPLGTLQRITALSSRAMFLTRRSGAPTSKTRKTP